MVVTTINNPQKIHPPAYLSVDEVQVQDQTILHVYVPESSQIHRCNGRIYDRNEDGDLDITDHTRLVSELYAHFRDSYIIPGLESGVIEMTQPDSPKSPTQRYRLTSKGYDVLNKLE